MASSFPKLCLAHEISGLAEVRVEHPRHRHDPGPEIVAVHGLTVEINAVVFGYSVDSAGDGMFDDTEASLGSSPFGPDTDGDDVIDVMDPLPLDAGVGSAWLAGVTGGLAVALEDLDPCLVNAPNDNAAAGQLGSLATRAMNAAESFEAGRSTSATTHLENILDAVDTGSDQTWLPPSDEADELALVILGLLELAEFE